MVSIDEPGLEGDEPDRRPDWRSQVDAARPYLGWGCIAAGGVLLVLGYVGVSGETIVSKQLPYVVSGGIGGVFLAIVGACFLLTGDRNRGSGRPDRVERMVGELHSVLLDHIEAAQPDSQTTANQRAEPATTNSDRVLVVDGGETFHRASCAMVADRATTTVVHTVAAQRGLRPCPVCAPATSPAG
jgi:hypothetical protein